MERAVIFNESDQVPNETPSKEEWHGRVQAVMTVGGINLCGFILCCLALTVTVKAKLKLARVNCMIVNLLLASLLHTLMFVAPQTVLILYREQFSPLVCGWLGYAFFVLSAQMIIFPPFLALNRYVALYNPRLYDRLFSANNIFYMIGASWLLSILIPLPFQLGGKTGYDHDNGHCCIVVRDSFWWTILYGFVVLVPLVGLCDSIMLYCNFKIYTKLHDHANANSLASNVVRENREIFYFMIFDTIIPLCFHTMYHVAKVAYTYRTNKDAMLFFPAFYTTSAFIRAVVIVAFLRPYRTAFLKMLSIKTTPPHVSSTCEPQI